MALGHARSVTHDGRGYEWVARQRQNTLRVVVQDVTARGQLLIAHFHVLDIRESGERYGDFYARTELGPESVRRQIAEALASGWQSTVKGLPPFTVGAAISGAGGFPQPWGNAGITPAYVEDLWSVLRAIRRDLAWRERLGGTYGYVHEVPPEYLSAVSPELAARVAARGGVEIYERGWNPKTGDYDPYLAARYRGSWLEALVAVSHWYRPAEPVSCPLNLRENTPPDGSRGTS